MKLAISSLTEQFPPQALAAALAQVSETAVLPVLAKSQLTPQDLLILLSPAAEKYLERLAEKARQLTLARFGRTMKLYTPLYLSNECTNTCRYCGFNQQHPIPRRTLSLAEVQAQADYLHQQGFQNLLLVSGESRQHVPVAFLEQCLQALRPEFPELSIEVYPLEKEEYRRLVGAGLYGLAIYQETYLPEVYQAVHGGGEKQNYAYRLNTPERAGQAGMRQISLGVLLGLADFRLDGFYLGMHAQYLERTYWRTLIALSFPRIQKAMGNFQPPAPVSNTQLVQLVTALRLFLPHSPFSLSTREPGHLRDQLFPLGFTQVSAGSCTVPGGYGQGKNAGEQFQVEDTRSPAEIAGRLNQQGYEPVWKDWEVL